MTWRSNPTPISAARLWQAAGWLLLVAAVFLTVSPSRLRPVTGVEHHIEHALAFAVLGFAFGMGYSKRQLLFFRLSALIVLLELSQVLLPDRHARLSDLLVNEAGMSIGLLAAAAINRVTGRS